MITCDRRALGGAGERSLRFVNQHRQAEVSTSYLMAQTDESWWNHGGHRSTVRRGVASPPRPAFQRDGTGWGVSPVLGEGYYNSVEVQPVSPYAPYATCRPWRPLATVRPDSTMHTHGRGFLGPDSSSSGLINQPRHLRMRLHCT